MNLRFDSLSQYLRFLFLFSLILVIFKPNNIVIGNIIYEPYRTQTHNQDSYSSEIFDGYNIYVLERMASSVGTTLNRTLLVTDLSGNIYFQREIDPDGSMSVVTTEFINSTTILYGDRAGAHLWNLETNKTKFLNFDGHHDYEINLVNGTFFALHSYDIEIAGFNYTFDKIQEYNENGILVWEKDTRDFLSTNQWCPFEDGGVTRDISHTNSISYDESEDVLYVNPRNVNTFYKIDHKTGDVLWGVGEYGNFTNYDIKGNEVEALFYHSHALKIVRNNTFFCFDNDRHNQTDGTSEYSRLVEIYVDEDKMQANTTWEWVANPEYHCEFWGDHDLLPNNNRFGVFGTHKSSYIGFSAVLIELNYAGDVVWEYKFPNDGSESFGIYQVDRFRFTPVVSEPLYINQGINNSYYEWKVWYNFFSKTIYTGSYYINIDNSLVKKGPIEFPRFWQSSTIRYYTTELDLQQHNISLIVGDEAGHLSNESQFFSPLGHINHNSFLPLRTATELITIFSILIPNLVGVILYFRKNRKSSV